MKTVVSVLDSAADPDLRRPRCLTESWRRAIRPVHSAPLINASNRPIHALGSRILFVRIVQLHLRVQFSVIVSMAVDCTSGTITIDRHGRAIVILQRKILSHQEPAVAYFAATQPSVKPAPYAHRTETGAVNDLSTFRKVRLVRTDTVLPATQIGLCVSRPAAGRCFLQNHPRTAMRNLVLMAQGVMDVVSYQRFTVCVNSFGPNPSTCQKTPFSASHCLHRRTL